MQHSYRLRKRIHRGQIFLKTMSFKCRTRAWIRVSSTIAWSRVLFRKLPRKLLFLTSNLTWVSVSRTTSALVRMTVTRSCLQSCTTTKTHCHTTIVKSNLKTLSCLTKKTSTACQSMLQGTVIVITRSLLMERKSKFPKMHSLFRNWRKSTKPPISPRSPKISSLMTKMKDVGKKWEQWEIQLQLQVSLQPMYLEGSQKLLKQSSLLRALIASVYKEPWRKWTEAICRNSK